MSKLDKYFNSRAQDKRFKLLHEENSYLKMLKGETSLAEEAKEKETELLNEADDLATSDDEGEDQPEDQSPEGGSDIKESEIMEAWLEDTYDPEEIEEISISVARKASAATARKVASLKKRKLTPGLTGKAGRKVRMGRV